MSTCVNDNTVIVKRAGKDRCVVDFYDQHMGGVDKSGQMLTSYEIERKRVKKSSSISKPECIKCSYCTYVFR